MIDIKIQQYIKTLSLADLEELLALVKFRLAQEKFKLQGKKTGIKKNTVYGEKNS